MATVNNINRVSFVAPSWEWYGYQMDPNNPKGRVSGKFFSDKVVRQALYMAVDRQKIADKVFFKQAVPATSILPATSWALTSDLPKYPYDPAKAKSMLDTAGWAAGSDGTRAKGGQKLSFEMITNKGNKTRESVIQILAESWKQIGVDAQVKLIQFSEYVKTRQTLDFDMVLGGISFGVDPSAINSQYEAKFIGKGANRMGYRNPQVDDLLDKAVAMTDRAKRKELYIQVQKIVMEDLPVGPLVLSKSLWGISKRVMNFTPGPFNRYAARPWLNTVWVTDGK
jgi:peptide/nickel transport system substrate-binding protein